MKSLIARLSLPLHGVAITIAAALLSFSATAMTASQDWVKAYIASIMAAPSSPWDDGTNPACIVTEASDTNLVNTVLAWDGVESTPYVFLNRPNKLAMYQDGIQTVITTNTTSAIRSTNTVYVITTNQYYRQWMTVDGVTWPTPDPTKPRRFVLGDDFIEVYFHDVADTYRDAALKED